RSTANGCSGAGSRPSFPSERVRAGDGAASRLLRLAGRAEAPPLAHPLPELLPLLRGHVLATLLHAAADSRAEGAASPTPAEQAPAKHQKPQRLPERDLGPAEERRQQPVPQMLHDFTAEGDEYRDAQDGQRSDPDQILHSWSHVRSLTFF